MSDNIVFFDGVTRLDIPPERVLNSAKEANLENCVVIGWEKNGDFYFASSIASGPEVIWLLELAKKKLLEIKGEDI
jgi:hypothetical protein